jgi:predicted RNA-binding Zn-ribbon protein involved in translation (DUF1610 family)
MKVSYWIKRNKVVDVYDWYGAKTWAIRYRCNNCGFIHTVIEDFGRYPYCPQCGSEMSGEVRCKDGGAE